MSIPSDISGLQLWLKADAGVLNSSGEAAANGDAVATWLDQSGNARHYTQGTPGNRPTLASAYVKGLPALAFGADDYLRLGANAIARNLASLTLMMVYMSTVSGSGVTPFGVSTEDSSQRNLFNIGASTVSGYSITARRLTADTAVSVVGGVFVPGEWQNHEVTLDWANSDLYEWVNGSLVGSEPNFQTAGNTANADAQRSTIGANNNTVPGSFLNGHVGELLCFAPKLSDENRVAMEQYLSARWVAKPKAHIYICCQGGD